jgi:hypothetical protein
MPKPNRRFTRRVLRVSLQVQSMVIYCHKLPDLFSPQGVGLASKACPFSGIVKLFTLRKLLLGFSTTLLKIARIFLTECGTYINVRRKQENRRIIILHRGPTSTSIASRSETSPSESSSSVEGSWVTRCFTVSTQFTDNHSRSSSPTSACNFTS